VADTPDARFQELLLHYGAFLRRTIATLCPRDSGVSCDDIEQEARIGLWTVLRGEREIAFPASYIYRVAVSATIRAIRRARARREEPLPEDGEASSVAASAPLRAPADESPHTLAERLELRREIGIALAELPENRRVAVTLYLQGLTTTEIGELRGWSEAKARNLVYRGREDLQQALRKRGIEYRR
jgi:RNA polymerase sigma-70 factor (ECF subfamily)